MKLTFTLIFSFIGSLAWAQQKANYSQYTLNNYLHNPAVSGIEDYSDVRMGFRKQWIGVEGSPRTYYLSAHMPINKVDVSTKVSTKMKNGKRVKSLSQAKRTSGKAKPHHGLGFILESDKSGALERTSLNGSYAVHVPLSRQTKIAVGASGGFINYTVNANYLNITNDPGLMTGNLKNTFIDLNVGAWLYSKNYFAGVSTAHIAGKKQNFIQTTSINDNAAPLQKHYYLTTGVRINTGSALTLAPSILVKIANPSPVTTDFNLKAIYADRVYIGGTYRTGDALSFLAGCNLSSAIGFGYSYDATTSALGNVNQGSHEIMVNFKLMNKNKIICPDFLW